ncbi:type VI secretion system protein TssL, long form [Enterobacter sp. ENT03]|uniref:type VI secretion system protein TssL, long form n=1 Tax=Enterobacter sp. ENT03 TaxID=2854780 RepID=UPI001C4695D6|nr:type VI secretion system protein TssL, long form [Enterobacter sp. ENT03]MBV7407020.1 type VI secretion system protein TssL, long form [Enterobacter sp. ENT03]
MTDSIITPPAANTLSFQSATPSQHNGGEYENALPDSRPAEMKVIIEDGPDIRLRLAEISTAANPLLAAARSLLCALAQMPGELEAGFVEHYRTLLVREVHLYQTLCDQANLRREHVLAVRYCLCTALDEAANNTVWGRRGVWAGKSLLVTFHGESEGGIKLFQIIGRLAANFQEHGDVLEVIYHILGLGFEGRYSMRPDGRKQLDDIRQQLLTQLSQRRDPVTPVLSPGFQGAIAGRLRRMHRVPVWLSASLAVLVMLTIFGLYSHRMMVQTDTVTERIDAIGKNLPPPPVPVHKLRLKILLADEIARKLLTVEEDDHHSRVVFRGDAMFVPGKTVVNETLRPVIDKAAREIARVGGAVTVTGHTDSQPIHSAEFPSNQVLSEKRATEVAALLTSGGVPAGRIRIVGKGDSVPVADNRSKTGRAQNRRVEILVVE